MLNLELCRFDFSVPALVADASKIPDEGMALVIAGALAGGDGVNVKPATDTAGERFYGVSSFERRPPAFMPVVEEFVLPDDPADGAVVHTLKHKPNAASFVVFDDGTALTSQAGANTNVGLVIDTDTGEVKAEATSGTARYMGAAAAAIANGSTVRVQYAYTPTVMQQVALVGSHINYHALHAGAAVACIRKGQIFTTYYDTASGVYEVGGQIGLDGGGKFQGAAAANVDLPVDRAVIIHVPSVDTPELGIELF